MQHKHANLGQSRSEECEKGMEKVSLTSLLKNPQVFLQTFRVKLRNGKTECVVRVILNSCSHRSYILNSAVSRVGYQPAGQLKMIHMLFGGVRAEPQDHKGYLIYTSDLNNTFECNFVALSLKNIVNEIRSVDNGSWIEELRQKGIYLSDFGSTNEPILILIEADVLARLQTGKYFNLKCGPTAIETKLG